MEQKPIILDLNLDQLDKITNDFEKRLTIKIRGFQLLSNDLRFNKDSKFETSGRLNM